MTESAGNRSRRSVLVASLGGLAAVVAHAFRPPSALASDGDPVIVGEEVSATDTTTIRNLTTSSGVFHVHSELGTAISGVGYGGNGVQGESGGVNGAGVWGYNPSGAGVAGESVSGNGVYGNATAGTGVYAHNSSLDQPAMLGWGSSGGAGVFGFAGQGVPPTAPLDTGIYGLATGYAQRPASAAVGVHGNATVGTGVLAQADAAGTALRVLGKATFSSSGVLTIAAGKGSASKSVSGLTSNSLVFAVVRTGGSGVWVRKVTPKAGGFTVYLNKAAGTTATITWIAFG